MPRPRSRRRRGAPLAPLTNPFRLVILWLGINPHQLSLPLLPPGGIPEEQTQLMLRRLVAGHFVFVLAALLGEGADALVDPFVAVDLETFLLAAWVGAGVAVLGSC